MKKKPPPNRKHDGHDSNQSEFGIIWQLAEYPFRLRAGDVIRFDDRLCRVIRVNECAAVVIMNRPVREFKTRFDKPVRFQPPPKITRMSPNAEVEILNRKT
ncbi:MAG: hypothetical protein P4L87_20345 [Formivibrio sp.]|nr:hypothetical protein [Formivibrio sp.]